MIAKKQLAAASMLAVFSFSAFADNYPDIYPFVPMETATLNKRAQESAEDPNFIRNIFDVHSQGLSRGKTKEQPWTSTYWPLNKGLIADPYKPNINPFLVHRELSWTPNYKRLKKRRKKMMKSWHKLDQDDLDKMAPSEKYDILLGDYKFDLTKRVVDYMGKWGSAKENSFLSSLDIIGGNSVKLAEKMVSEGQFESLEEALPFGNGSSWRSC
jgi:hypothetical protein